MRRLIAATLLILALMHTGAQAAPGLSVQDRAGVESRDASSSAVPKSIGVIVRFKQPSTAPLAAQLLSAMGGSTASPADKKRGIYAFRTPDTETAELYAARLMTVASGIDYAEPNYVRELASYAAPTDPDFTDAGVRSDGTNYYVGAKNWWLRSMKAPAAWAIGEGDAYPTHGSTADIKIAVLDTGFYLAHPEFAGGTLIAGTDECASYNPIRGTLTTDSVVEPDPNADAGYASHGTGVAAAVGAGVDGSGTVGSGWNPTIIGYKVAGPLTAPWGESYPAGSVVLADLAAVRGIYDALDAGCKVISMSFGGPSSSAVYENAVAEAHRRGAVVVAAVGNDGTATVNYPAGCAQSTGVGAIGLVGGNESTSGAPTVSAFSSYGPGVVDLVAPGEMMWTAIRPDRVVGDGPPGYQFRRGTSFAAPAVAGAIAYLWRAMPELTNDQIVSRVQSAAVDMGAAGRDDYYGHGLVDMESAYERLIADYPMLAKPTLSASAYMRGGQPVSWSASGGHEVSYLVSIDGALRSAQHETAYALPSLPDGEHIISVLPTSSRNWNTSSVATQVVTLDSVAPAIGGFSRIGETLSWSVTEANPYTVQARIDGSLPATVATNEVTVSGLQAGAHTLRVRATDLAGNASAWTVWDFAYGVLPPVVPSVVVTDALSATVVWPAVGGATSYECVVGTGSTLVTTSTALEVGGIGEGATEVSVRALSAEGERSEWATATVTNVAVVPAAPAVFAASVIGTPSISASWEPVRDALLYEYRLDGGSSTLTSGTTASMLVTDAGPHLLEVRSVNNLRRSAWATATVTYDPRSSTAIALSASTTRLAYPATTVTLIGSVSAPGAIVHLQSSVDGVTWSEAGTATATGSSPGAVVISLRPTRSSWYRLVFDGDVVWSPGNWRPATSAALSIAYAPRLSAPSTPTRVKRRARFVCTALVSAAVPNRFSVLTLSFQRYQKVSGRYKWVVRKSIRLRGSVYSASTLRYRTSTSLPYAGKWRVSASYGGAPMHANLTSNCRYFTVR